MSDEELSQDRLTTLKERADQLGIKYHPSIGVDTLAEKIKAVMDSTATTTQAETPAVVIPAAAPTASAPVEETLGQERQRLKREAHALVRIRLSCMNPAKKEWTGEIMTVGNSLVGSITKFIPFNAEEGWHVPQIMLQQLQDRKCQIFTTIKQKNGVAVRQGKLIKEFAIEILPPLTEAELHDLAQRQAMSGAID